MRLTPIPLAALLVGASILVPFTGAQASTPTAGADVSWPQCDSPLPTDALFGVVGVNTGLGNATNPCLASQLAWAAATPGTTSQAPVSLYVMAQDPGLLASWWPDSDRTKDGTPVPVPAEYGTCTTSSGSARGEASAACAYVYGYDMAHEDLTGRGVSSPSAYRWWIDVEDTNTWALSTTANRADVEGMAAAFRAAGVGVGLYSTTYQWTLLTGTTPPTSPLAGLPSWIADTGDEASAEANCYTTGLTPNSTVLLAQYQTGDQDRDLICHRLTTAAPSLTGTGAVDRLLTAHAGTWGPTPVTLHYRWNRDGTPISGATASSYRTVAADAGHAVTVTVSGSRSGWTTGTRTSTAVRIAVPVSRLSAPGTLGTGKSLLAANGRYRLTQQTDGNLVLAKDGAPIWSSHRSGTGFSTTMQADGNLVTYAPGHHAVWATRTTGKHGISAVVQSDGNLVLYTAAGKAVWATHTSGR